MIRHQAKKLFPLVLATILFADGSIAVSDDNDLSATIGSHRVLLPAGYEGLNYFPDEPISIISVKPFRFLLTAGNQTYLMQGSSISDSKKVRQVLGPGQKGSFDNGYAGVGAIYHDQKKNQILAFYHAEDKEGMPKVSYNKEISGAYWSIGMAVSRDSGLTFQKVGKILGPSVRKADVSKEKNHQGIGDVSVIADHTGQFLYAYFTDITRKKESHSAKIGMARCKISEATNPKSWRKFNQGTFSEAGQGGMESGVVFPPTHCDVFAPNVTYIRSMRTYFMVCNVLVFKEFETGRVAKSGIYFTSSVDGVNWLEPKFLTSGLPIPIQGKEYVAHPSIHIQSSTSSKATGTLLYCYSPSWGTQKPFQPHHLASRPLALSKNSMTTNKKAKLDETSFPGKYYLDVLEKETGELSDEYAILDFKKDNTLSSNIGGTGTWKITGSKLHIITDGFLFRPGRLQRDGRVIGDVQNERDQRWFRYTLRNTKNQ